MFREIFPDSKMMYLFFSYYEVWYVCLIFKNKELPFREKAKKTAMIWDEGKSLDEAWRAPAAETFLRRLKEQRARSFMRDPEYLKSLRHDAEGAKQMQKWFGSIWAEYGTDVYKLIRGVR